ncbi:hypothetical protein GCM10027270_29880 [Nocardioides ginkgobilobae]
MSRSRTRVATVSVALVMVLSACGSQLAPADVVAAGGTAPGGVVVGADGQPVSADRGTTGGTTGSDGGTTGGTGTGATGGGGTTGGGTTGGTTGGGAGPGEGPPIKTGSCEGFQNGPGITDDTITIGNSSDISGPVPGLFESAQDATKAFVAYFNRVNPDGICGRTLVLKNYDSRTDASADQRNHVDACENVFAMVGSMSAFDSGGAATTEACGLPDIRSAGVTGDRQECSTCFGAQSTIAGEVNNAVADYVLENFRDASQNAASLYINAGAAAENGQLQPRAMTQRGMRFTVVRGIETSEFNYAPFVQELKDEGVGYVQMTAAVPQFVRLAQAMTQQGYEPDVFMIDPTAYEPALIEQGGEDVEGITIYTNFVPFEEADRSPETKLYLDWLQTTKPGATPDFFGVFSWSAARLFVELAAGLGGKLSRETLLEAIRGTDDWTANGLHAPQNVGPKRTGECFRFLQVRGGKFVPLGSRDYTCNGTTVVR